MGLNQPGPFNDTGMVNQGRQMDRMIAASSSGKAELTNEVNTQKLHQRCRTEILQAIQVSYAYVYICTS